MIGLSVITLWIGVACVVPDRNPAEGAGVGPDGRDHVVPREILGVVENMSSFLCDHGTTYGGNPLACAVAGTVFDIINTTEVLDGVRARHALFMEGLKAINARRRVFDDRHPVMAEAIDGYFKQADSHFVVIGVGHMFGDNIHEYLAPCIYEGEGEMLGMGFFKSLVKQHGKTYFEPVGKALAAVHAAADR